LTFRFQISGENFSDLFAGDFWEKVSRKFWRIFERNSRAGKLLDFFWKTGWIKKLHNSETFFGWKFLGKVGRENLRGEGHSETNRARKILRHSLLGKF
jgi:hypothetical protein